MKVVIAMDSFKGSMTSIDAGRAAKLGVLQACPSAQVIVRPLADGGEGTTDAFIEGLGGKLQQIQVTGPLGAPVSAKYGILPDGKTAVMEMAEAAGITLVSEQKNPLHATTYGVGEMIRDAIHKGCRNFIVGIGGSATNDGGVGMLQALGYNFYDSNENPISGGASILADIEKIDAKHCLPELSDCTFQIACDVTNPLYGENGATYIFGPQKGITPEQKPIIDAAMKHYATIASSFLGFNYASTPGTGASGGLGFAFLAFLHGTLVSGVDLILNAIHLEQELADADYVLTGEGLLDLQTAMGKVPIGVTKIAKKYGAIVLAFSGGVTPDAKACNNAGIDAYFPIVRGVTSLEAAMNTEQAKANMANTVEQVFRLIVANSNQ